MIFWLVAALQAGCELPAAYEGKGQQVIGRVTDRSAWSASGSLADCANAIDRNINTMAIAKEGDPAPTLTIDLGQPCMFNMIVVDHGRNEHNYARRVMILTSADGRRFIPQYTAPGTRRVSIYCLPTFVLARYVQIQASEPGDRPFSVAEVYLQ